MAEVQADRLGVASSFAVERGLIVVTGAHKSVRVYMSNTDSVATSTFPIKNGVPVYAGTTAIDGVPRPAARVQLDFVNIAGGSCGALLPTGSAVDQIDGRYNFYFFSHDIKKSRKIAKLQS